MIIQVKKFGTILVSRTDGREAWLAFQPVLREARGDEEIIVDFDGVIALGPSWTDEFLTPLRATHGDRVKLKNTKNASVVATLRILGYAEKE